MDFGGIFWIFVDFSDFLDFFGFFRFFWGAYEDFFEQPLVISTGKLDIHPARMNPATPGLRTKKGVCTTSSTLSEIHWTLVKKKIKIELKSDQVNGH